MIFLALLRHAKAVKDAAGGDHARPLAPVGREAAAIAGRRLASVLPPDPLVVASDAVRTRETAALAFPSTSSDRLRLAPALYAAPPQAMLALLQGLPSSEGAVVVVGHNPGISDLANRLTGQGDADARDRIAQGLATADAVVLRFETDWAGLAPGTGHVVAVLARKEPGA